MNELRSCAKRFDSGPSRLRLCRVRSRVHLSGPAYMPICSLYVQKQVRNQGGKSFLRRAQFFETMSIIFFQGGKDCTGGRSPLWLRASLNVRLPLDQRV